MANFLKVLFYLMVISVPMNGQDLGVHGKVYPIDEADLIDYMHDRINNLDDESLNVIHQSLQEDYQEIFHKPSAVAGITETITYRIEYFDPTIVAKKAIKDSEGNIIVQKGTTYNPLDYLSLSQNLLFFDGENPDHIEWAKNNPSSTKWILVKGSPIQLEKKENKPVFFDQYGMLCKKLSIESVPCKVSQSGKKLKVEFIPIPKTPCDS